MEDDVERQILVLHASETGTAEDVAFTIGRHLRRWHWRTRIVSMEDSSLDDLLEWSLVVTVCSTTGNGIEPESMTAFWASLVRSDLPPNLLDHLDIASFSLGDSSYERFCWSGKKLHRRLVALGAHDIIERVDADEQHYLGIEGSLSAWLDSLTAALDEIHPPPSEPLPASSSPEPRICLAQSTTSLAPSQTRSYPAPRTYRAKLTTMQRITRTDWYQDVRHIEFDTLDPIIYEPGDIAVLYPSNQAEDVQTLIKGQNWENIIDQVFNLQSQDDDPLPRGLPQQTSLRQLLHDYLDIRAVPRRSFFEFARYFTTDEREREKLDEFLSSPEGQGELYTYCQRPRRTTLEVLADFRSVRIPLDYLFDVFAVIRPRKFSIASCLEAHPGKIQLCVAMVKYKSLVLRTPRTGLCSTWLQSLPIGTELHIGLQKGILGSKWKVEGPAAKPIVFVGPGTGIAPLRAILEHRMRAGVKDNLMFFGCRSKKADFHYRSELEAAVEDGYLQLIVAASRDQEHKLYVQDAIRENKHLVHDFIFVRGGSVVISGSSGKMPAGVRLAVKDIMKNLNRWSDDQAEKYLLELEASGRWMEETW